MYIPTSLFILAASKLLPIVLRKTKWYGKSDLHRRALKAYKKGNLHDAVEYNLNSQMKDTEYENALILRDILLMRIDADEAKLHNQIMAGQQQHNEVKQTLYTVNSDIAKTYTSHTKRKEVLSAFPAIIGTSGLVISGNYSSIQGLIAYIMLVLVLSTILLLALPVKSDIGSVKSDIHSKLWQKRHKLKEELEVITAKNDELVLQRSYLIKLRQYLFGG